MDSIGGKGLHKDEKGYLHNDYGEVWGYCRVSTKEQNIDRQEDAMLAYGVMPSHIFIEHETGKHFNRPVYKRMIRIIRKGDIIVIKSLDRLGRDYKDINSQWRMITQDIGCGIHVIDMPVLNISGTPGDFMSLFITDIILNILSYVAQNERETTLKRQQEGIAAARKRHHFKIGRPKTRIPTEFWNVYLLWKSGKIKSKNLAKTCKKEYGMCQRSFYRRIRELDARFGDLTAEALAKIVPEDVFPDGIEWYNEQYEKLMDIYNPYNSMLGHGSRDEEGYYILHRKMKPKHKPIAELEAEEEEELRQIILAKRQAEFAKVFGETSIEDFDITAALTGTKRRGKPSTVARQRQAELEAHQNGKVDHPSKDTIKTVIID